MIKFYKKHKKAIGLAILFLAVTSFGLAHSALALAGSSTCPNDGIVLQVWMPGVGWCVSGFPEYLQAIYNLFVGISGILAVIMIMFGGFQWLIAGGNPTKITGAKTQILSALAGLTLLLASYTILNVINPNLKSLNLGVTEIATEQLDWYGFCSREKMGGAVQTVCGATHDIPAANGGGVCKGVMCIQTAELLKGVSTASDLAVWLGDKLNVFAKMVCLSDGAKQVCGSEYVLNKAGASGYGTGAKIRDNLISPTGTKYFDCGKIYHVRGITTTYFEDLSIGGHCYDNKSCVIDVTQGYEITMDHKTADNSGYDIPVVGKFVRAFCL